MALNAVQRFRHQHDVRAYRRQLFNALAQSFVFRLLPSLKEVDVYGYGRDGIAQPLTPRMSRLPATTLAGVPGSGRRLVLRQVALMWSATTGAPLPVPLVLPRIDDEHTAPEALIEREIARLHPSILATMPKLFGTTDAGATKGRGRWGLLVEGLDELQPSRQAAWRAALQRVLSTAPSTYVTVAVATSEQEWPGFTALHVARPTPDMIQEWVKRLADSSQWHALYDALRPGGPLEIVGERLVEVALLAWMTRRTEVPRSRADLYAQAAVALLRMFPDAGVSMEELQRLAAYDEQPPAVLPGLLARNLAGDAVFNHQLARLYLAAHQLVTEGRYELLAIPNQDARNEIVRFAVALADDPTPIYAALWSKQPSADDVLTLGQCLRERPPAQPIWTLRIASALALLARQGSPAQQHAAATQLNILVPQLNRALSAVARSGEQAQRAIERLFTRLPVDVAVACATWLILNADTPTGLAWVLADQLAEIITSPETLPAPPTDQHAFARWAYVLALDSPESRARLVGAVDELLDVLRHAGAGEARVSRVAAALRGEHAEAPQQEQSAAAGERESGEPSGASLHMTAVPEAQVEIITHDATDTLQMLENSARDTSLPLYKRLLSVAALARHAESNQQLQALLRDDQMDAFVRAAAARALGSQRDTTALPIMCALAGDPNSPPELLESICAALGEIGDAVAATSLLELLARTAADPILTVAAIDALGAIGAPQAVPLLAALPGTGAWERLQGSVRTIDPRQHSTTLLDAGALPARMAVQLVSALSSVPTHADQPTTLAEFMAHEADHIRSAAAAALARIGGENARAALQKALAEGATGNTTGDVLRALARLDPSGNAAILSNVIASSDIDVMTRWLAVQCLQEQPNSVEAMRHLLAQEDLDPFTRGALAEALGQAGATAALPLLRQLAIDTYGDAHVRSQAIIALGKLDDPAAEGTLIQIIRSTTEDDALRGLAAQHLPSNLSADSQHFLRDLLRRERPPEALAAGAIHALGRARNREAMPLLLRYCQDGQPVVAQAALAALKDMADSSVVPVLVQISQDLHADAATRLEALGALLRVGGDSYRPLLRSALEQGPLPLRLQALEHLLGADPPSSELAGMLASVDWPLPLRLRLLECCTFTSASYPVLIGIVENQRDQVQIRCRVATLLGQTEHTTAVNTLARLAIDPNEIPAVRLRCIEALGMIGNVEAGVALSQFVEHDAQSPALRRAAVQALTTIASRAI
jgi:HEAT repeat protein